MGLNALLVCLYEESEALDHLAFKLEQEQLVLMAGKPRLLDRHNQEFQEAVNALDLVGRRRQELVGDAASQLGLGPSTTLSELADASTDDDERRVLRERRDTMRGLVDRISTLCALNREILARNLAATTDALALLGERPSYTAMATTSVGAPRPRIVDARA